MIADATIARLRSQIESNEIPPNELTEVLLIILTWYNDQKRIDQRAPETDPDNGGSSEN